MRRVLAPALVALLAVSGCGSLAARPSLAPQAPVAGVTAAGLASPAGNLARRGAERAFRDADRNGDGRLTVPEAGLPREAFDKLDRDGDGTLSLAEMVPDELIRSYVPVIERFFQSSFRQADANGDGRLSAAERQALPFGEGLFEAAGGQSWDYATFVQQFSHAVMGEGSRLEGRRSPSGRTPVLVVQGYLEPSYYFMYGIYRHLQKQGWPVYGINLFPNVDRADAQVPRVEAKIREILRETGASKVNLVNHSFGGLISRRIIQARGGDRYVDRYVSIATPHFGTLWCYAGPILGGACIDMVPGSEFLTELNRQTIWPPVKYSNIWTKGDEITLPPAKTNPLPGAKNYPPVPWTDHLLILWSPTTYRYVDEALAGS